MRRRDCLTGLCALAGLQFVPQTVFGLPKPIEESSENTFIYDVVVVGTGLAGHCAAISAKEAGAERVLMIDKAPLVGGHSETTSSWWTRAAGKPTWKALNPPSPHRHRLP